MTRFYLMRHGQTLFNTLNRIQGWCDSPLTEKGRDQARQVRAYFQKHHLNFDQYYCTTTERASDTLELVTGQTAYHRVKGLKEMNFGIFEGQPEYLHPKTTIVGHFGNHYAVSHAGALMTFLHAVEPERAFQSCPGNCAILVFDYDGTDFHFIKLIDPIADQEFSDF